MAEESDQTVERPESVSRTIPCMIVPTSTSILMGAIRFIVSINPTRRQNVATMEQAVGPGRFHCIEKRFDLFHVCHQRVMEPLAAPHRLSYPVAKQMLQGQSDGPGPLAGPSWPERWTTNRGPLRVRSVA
jgi:hypothetical protein